MTTQNVVYRSNEPVYAAHTHSAPIVERTYDSTAQVIRHDEKTIYESHTAATQIDNVVLPVKIETHMAQPIIKEHHRDIIHEHHQDVIHEHHKNIIHE